MNTANQPVVIGLVDKQPSALRFAIAEARSTVSPLRVVHSAGFPTQVSEFYAGPDVLGDLRAAGQEVLDEARHFIEEQAPALDIEYILTTVPPVQALGDESVSARVMVVGSDDVPWFDRLLRTKVSGHLARHAPCPVVVVPEHDYPGGYDGNIILTLDGDTSADGPIRFAFEEARARDGVLHTLHAPPPGTVASDSETIKANLAEVLADWRESYPDVLVVEAYTVGDVKAAVLRATQTAALVVVGRPHGHAMPFAVSRPLAIEVLRRSHCPVAVVPASYHGA